MRFRLERDSFNATKIKLTPGIHHRPRAARRSQPADTGGKLSIGVEADRADLARQQAPARQDCNSNWRVTARSCHIRGAAQAAQTAVWRRWHLQRRRAG